MAGSGEQLAEWLSAYNPDEITIGVVASHSALQILHGARAEGFRTLGIAVGEGRRKVFKAFPGAEPDEWLMLDNYNQMLDKAELFTVLLESSTEVLWFTRLVFSFQFSFYGSLL